MKQGLFLDAYKSVCSFTSKHSKIRLTIMNRKIKNKVKPNRNQTCINFSQTMKWHISCRLCFLVCVNFYPQYVDLRRFSVLSYFSLCFTCIPIYLSNSWLANQRGGWLLCDLLSVVRITGDCRGFFRFLQRAYLSKENYFQDLIQCFMQNEYYEYYDVIFQKMKNKLKK